MKISQQRLHPAREPFQEVDTTLASAHVLLLSGPTERVVDPLLLQRLRAAWPAAHLIGCATAGGILADGVEEEMPVLTSVVLQATRVRSEWLEISEFSAGEAAGMELGQRLQDPELRHVFLLCDGLRVQASALLRGLRSSLGGPIALGGGLAADGLRFAHAPVLLNERCGEGAVAALGFYGSRFEARSFAASGWMPFGNQRMITRSEGNTVFEIDGRRALDVYSAYLGDGDRNLLVSGIVFPLAMRGGPNSSQLIRSLRGVNPENGALTFGGEVPQGTQVQLMHANYMDLVAGAARAAQRAAATPPDLAILISCLGRKVLIGGYTELEIEAASDRLPPPCFITGFYGGGEIGVGEDGSAPEVHNQTFSITTWREAGGGPR